MKSKLMLERHVRAARLDLPNDAELRAALGPLYTAASPVVGTPLTAAKQAVLLKWVVLAVVLGAAAVVQVLIASSAPVRRQAPPGTEVQAPPLPAPRTATDVQAPSMQPQAANAPAAPSAAKPPSEPAARVNAARPRPRSAKSERQRVAAPPQARVEPSLAAVDGEARLVEAARAALHEDPSQTLRLSAEHAQSYPTGVLAPEREALAIQALALLGRESEARTRLKALEATFSRSIHVTRLHRLLGDVPSAEAK